MSSYCCLFVLSFFALQLVVFPLLATCLSIQHFNEHQLNSIELLSLALVIPSNVIICPVLYIILHYFRLSNLPSIHFLHFIIFYLHINLNNLELFSNIFPIICLSSLFNPYPLILPLTAFRFLFFVLP
jgi:hypothetical protein